MSPKNTIDNDLHRNLYSSVSKDVQPQQNLRPYSKINVSSMKGLCFNNLNVDSNNIYKEESTIEERYCSTINENQWLKETVSKMEQEICKLMHIDAITNRSDKNSKNDQISDSQDTIDLDIESIEKKLKEENFELKTKIIK